MYLLFMSSLHTSVHFHEDANTDIHLGFKLAVCKSIKRGTE